MKKSDTTKSSTGNKLTVIEQVGKSKERQIAELALSPVVTNTNTATLFISGTFGKLSLTESIDVMQIKVDKVKAGDLSDVEATLTAQAETLNSIFNELAARASLNIGTNLNATEIYLRMAFKAQTQCRSTIETLAEVKYPKAATFVKQQNVAYQQQVNNGGSNPTSTRTGAPAHGKNSTQCKNELLETQHGKRLDTRTTETTSGNDSELETVGKINRPTNRQRKAAQ
jgi:hypothetical protein